MDQDFSLATAPTRAGLSVFRRGLTRSAVTTLSTWPSACIMVWLSVLFGSLSFLRPFLSSPPLSPKKSNKMINKKQITEKLPCLRHCLPQTHAHALSLSLLARALFLSDLSFYALCSLLSSFLSGPQPLQLTARAGCTRGANLSFQRHFLCPRWSPSCLDAASAASRPVRTTRT